MRKLEIIWKIDPARMQAKSATGITVKLLIKQDQDCWYNPSQDDHSILRWNPMQITKIQTNDDLLGNIFIEYGNHVNHPLQFRFDLSNVFAWSHISSVNQLIFVWPLWPPNSSVTVRPVPFGYLITKLLVKFCNARIILVSNLAICV